MPAWIGSHRSGREYGQFRGNSGPRMDRRVWHVIVTEYSSLCRESGGDRLMSIRFAENFPEPACSRCQLQLQQILKRPASDSAIR